MSNSIAKDRNQSKIDFLESLQREYYVCEIKSKIYPKINDRKYYKRVMGNKKDKIENLSTNMGGVSNIFNSVSESNRIRKEVYPDKNTPKFDLTKEELELYYSIDSEVRVYFEDEIKIGKLFSKNIEKNICMVKLRGECDPSVHSLKNVARIL